MAENNPDADLDLPPEASHYAYRIGGHVYSKGKLKLGTLKHKNGNILKPFIEGNVRSAQELSFYEQVFKNPENDPILHELKNFIPSFHGTLDCTINGTSVRYLCTEDVCGNLQNPSVFSASIGPIQVEPTATKEKVEKEAKKYPPMKIFGFRIQGMKVYDHENQTYFSKDKTFGLKLKTFEKVHSGVCSFFNKQFGQINILILSGFLHWLLQLKTWFSKQRQLVFISSAILLVYESSLEPWITWFKKIHKHIANRDTCVGGPPDGDFPKEYVLHNPDCTAVFPCAKDEVICNDCKLSKHICIELQKTKHLYRVSAVDFAHVLPTTEEDSNYMFGLDNLIAHIHLLHNSYLQTS